jgi:NDP-sugar pyrophosphorylase family protein
VSLPPLFAELPEPLRDRFDPEAPWELLGRALDEALAALPEDAIEIPLSPDFHLAGDRIAIGPGTRIHPGAVIEGPVFIGREVQIRPGAFIRGGCWIGDRAVVGASTEIKHSILLAGAAAPHLAYVGDSVLGVKVNLGAGTVLSNFRHDGRDIAIPPGPHGDGPRIVTGRRKLGAILGDGVKTGCNSVLHPGVVVGRGTEIYPGVMLRAGVYPAGSVVKLRQELEVVEVVPRGTAPGA